MDAGDSPVDAAPGVDGGCSTVMRMRIVAAGLLIGALALLTGCIARDPIPAPPTTPTTAPLFADEDEALAAAEEAYRAYLAMVNQIANEGGQAPERIATFVTDEQYINELTSFERYVSTDSHSEGALIADSFELQSYSDDQIVTYLCLDASETRIVTSSGVDITPTDRTARASLQVSFEIDQMRLLIAENESWSGPSFC